MARCYIWMPCVAILCLLLLSSFCNTTIAGPAIATPTSTLLQDGDDLQDAVDDEDAQDGDDLEDDTPAGDADPSDTDQDNPAGEPGDQSEDRVDDGADSEDETEGEDESKDEPKTASFKPEAGSLSFLKLGLIVIIFLPWVGYVDSINRDTMQFGDKLKLAPEIWSPILVGSFLIGLLAVLLVPIYWAGFPFFVVAALAPPITYSFIRRSRVKNDDSLARAIRNKSGSEDEVEELPQDDGADLSISTGGADANEKQARLIRGRQSAEFPVVKNIIHDAQFKRTEQLLMDCGREQTKLRLLVDGVWHPAPSIEREIADGVVISLKSLAGLNPADRRNKQSGSFEVKSEFGKAKIKLATHGVPTGERVSISFIQAKKDVMRLDELGMFPDMMQQVCESLNTPGLTIISAPAGHGLTSTWQGAIASSDRLTRDCIGFYDENETETDIENIVPRPYNLANGETAFASLQKTLLSQPDAIIAPTIADSQTMDLLTQQANEQERSIVTRAKASTAAEAFLRTYAKSKDRNAFLAATKTVTCQRLLRRLCSDCRVEVQVNPKMIQKLGGNPKQQRTLFTQFKLPPPEQRIDEKGKPIEFPPCPTCGGLGYIGRIATFEVLQLDEQLRAVIRKKPQAAVIEAAAVKSGKLPLANQAYKLVLLGVTSLAEVQRIFNPPKKKS